MKFDPVLELRILSKKHAGDTFGGLRTIFFYEKIRVLIHLIRY